MASQRLYDLNNSGALEVGALNDVEASRQRLLTPCFKLFTLTRVDPDGSIEVCMIKGRPNKNNGRAVKKGQDAIGENKKETTA